MSLRLNPALVCIFAVGSLAAADPVVFKETFEDAATIQFKGVEAVTEGATKALKVSQTDASLSKVFNAPLEVGKVAGHTITISARVKADSVSEKPKPYQGIKVQIMLVNADDTKVYKDIRAFKVGTYDWTTESATLAVPADAKRLFINVGLEKVSGTAWIDDVTVTLADPAKP